MQNKKKRMNLSFWQKLELILMLIITLLLTYAIWDFIQMEKRTKEEEINFNITNPLGSEVEGARKFYEREA
jgi:membrane protein implicated in regulation of membrane protease activity